MKNRILTIFFFFLLITAACSDDDSSAPDKTPLLTRKTWSIVRIVFDGKKKDINGCFEENTFTFTADGKYTGEHDCAVVAVPPGHQNTWEFQDNQSKFKWNYDSGIDENTIFDIVKLDDEAFEIEAEGGDQAIRFEAVGSIN